MFGVFKISAYSTTGVIVVNANVPSAFAQDNCQQRHQQYPSQSESGIWCVC